jgi:outer membrane protein assembly factor BamB
LIDAEKAPPLLLAWSLNADAPKWSAAATQSPTSGALATKAGLVFHAEGEQLAALNAKTGEALWHSGTGLGVIGSIATFEQAGRQYIAVVAGGSAPASPQDQAVGAYKNLASTTALGPRLVVFGLPQ